MKMTDKERKENISNLIEAFAALQCEEYRIEQFKMFLDVMHEYASYRGHTLYAASLFEAVKILEGVKAVHTIAKELFSILMFAFDKEGGEK